MKKLRFVSLFVVLLVSLVFTSSISAKDTSGLTVLGTGIPIRMTVSVFRSRFRRTGLS